MENIHLKSLYNLYDKGTEMFEHIIFSFIFVDFISGRSGSGICISNAWIQIFRPLD